MSAMPATRGPISRDDLEAKFRELQGETERTTQAAKGTLIAAGAGIGLIILAAVFLFGRRRGKPKTTIVEVRRV
jgi:hypothetical protein